MATFDITAPDGSTYEVNAPEGTTEAQAMEYAKQQIASGALKANETEKPKGMYPAIDSLMGFLSENKGQRITDVARTAAQMPTFGGADELEAGVRSVAGEDYDTTLRDIRGANKQFQKERPGTALGIELASGLGTGFGTAKAATKMAPKLAEKIPRFFRVAMGGAGQGGALGFGSGTGGLENRTWNAGENALLGAGAGMGVYGLGRGVAAAGRGIKNAVKGPAAPRSAALDFLADDLAFDEYTPNKLKSRLSRLGQRATIADAGGANVLATARAAGALKGPSQNAIHQRLRARTQGESSRIGTRINRTLSPADYYDSQEVFFKRLRSNADKWYGKAYARKPLPKAVISKYLDDPDWRAGIKEAKAINRLSRLENPDIKTFPDDMSEGLAYEHLDDIKRGIDTLLKKKTYANEFGALNKRGAALKSSLKGFLKQADMHNPDYAKARKIYGGDAEVLQALEDGKDFMKLSARQNQKKISNLGSDAAKKAYRAGGARWMKDKIEGTPDNLGAARKLFGDSLSRGKIRSIMPDRKSYRRLAQTLRSEQRFKQVENTIMGGSQTQPRFAADEAMKTKLGTGAAVAASNLPVGHSLVVAAGARRIAVAQAQKIMTKRTAELAKMLVNQNPADNARVIDELIKRHGAAKGRKSAELSKAIARMAAQQLGLDE